MGSITLEERVQQSPSQESQSLDLQKVKLRQFDSFHQFLCTVLQGALSSSGKVPESILHQVAQGSVLWESCQLFSVLKQLLLHACNLPRQPLRIEQYKNGVVPIDSGRVLPWGQCPLAGWHEELGFFLLFSALQEQNSSLLEQAKKLVEWQKQLFSANAMPNQELFAQEGVEAKERIFVYSYALYTLAAKAFQMGDLTTVAANCEQWLLQNWSQNISSLLALPLEILRKVQEPAPPEASVQISRALCDPMLGLVGKRFKTGKALATLSGGGTGLGSFGFLGLDVKAWGPQKSSLGDCSAFGILSRQGAGQHASNAHIAATEEGILLKGVVKLADQQDNQLESLYNQAPAYEWLKVTQRVHEQRASLNLAWWSLDSSAEATRKVVWFLCADRCYLPESDKKLEKRSLTHYRGEGQRVSFSKGEGKLHITFSSLVNMEVIPLAGEKSFWGSDYLLAIELDAKSSNTSDWFWEVCTLKSN